jgi:hypothetical protein
MIEPFPLDWELVGLFECEPVLLVPGISWLSNRLIFETLRGADRLVCEIEPASDLMIVRWWQGPSLRLDLDLRRIGSLSVRLGPEGESLVAAFRGEPSLALPLELQLRPAIRLSWGTAQ